MNARGFAIATAGVIDVSTVSPHRRAAIVNWLHPRQPVGFGASEIEIERAWRELRTAEDECIEVEIAQLAPGEAFKPHPYSPDSMMQGDCRVCGHGSDKPWHKP